MTDDALVSALKEMYSCEKGQIKRVGDCSYRDFITHEEVGKDICQMKIKNMKTRDIAYAIQYGKIPDGRVMYRDGNRLNLSKENLYIIDDDLYLKAVDFALKILSEKSDKKTEYENPKTLAKYLAKKGVESMGFDNIIAEITLSKLGRKQKERAKKYVYDLFKMENI